MYFELQPHVGCLQSIRLAVVVFARKRISNVESSALLRMLITAFKVLGAYVGGYYGVD